MAGACVETEKFVFEYEPLEVVVPCPAELWNDEFSELLGTAVPLVVLAVDVTAPEEPVPPDEVPEEAPLVPPAPPLPPPPWARAELERNGESDKSLKDNNFNGRRSQSDFDEVVGKELRASKPHKHSHKSD